MQKCQFEAVKELLMDLFALNDAEDATTWTELADEFGEGQVIRALDSLCEQEQCGNSETSSAAPTAESSDFSTDSQAVTSPYGKNFVSSVA